MRADSFLTALPAYLKMAMKPFRPNARPTLQTYYEVPVEIIEEQDQLTEWAKRTVRLSPGGPGLR